METNEFYKCVEKHHSNLVKHVRGFIYTLKSKYNLTNENISEMFGVSLNDLEDMLHENWEGRVDSTVIGVCLAIGGKSFVNEISKYTCDCTENEIEEYLQSFNNKSKEDALCRLVNIFSKCNTNDINQIVDYLEVFMK